jgi:hypothetical protein
MATLTRVLICIGVIVSAGWLGLQAVSPEFIHQLWIESTTSEEDRELAVAEEYSRALDQHLLCASHRVAAKSGLVRELVAERLGLLEAAARLRDLDKQWPPSSFAAEFTGGMDVSTADPYCRQVLFLVETELSSEPARAARVDRRLRRDLQDTGYGGRRGQ